MKKWSLLLGMTFVASMALANVPLAPIEAEPEESGGTFVYLPEIGLCENKGHYSFDLVWLRSPDESQRISLVNQRGERSRIEQTSGRIRFDRIAAPLWFEGSSFSSEYCSSESGRLRLENLVYSLDDNQPCLLQRSGVMRAQAQVFDFETGFRMNGRFVDALFKVDFKENYQNPECMSVTLIAKNGTYEFDEALPEFFLQNIELPARVRAEAKCALIRKPIPESSERDFSFTIDIRTLR